MLAASGRKITSVWTGLERLRGKVSIKAVGPGFNGSESATERVNLKLDQPVLKEVTYRFH